MTYIAIALLFLLVLAAAYTDYKKTIIPNELILAGFFVAILLQSFGVLKEDWLTLLIDFLIFFLPLILMWIIGVFTSFQALAAGDVKLISVMALFVEPALLFYILLGALIFVSVANLSKISFSFYREMPREIYYFIFFGIPGKPKERLQNVPFGPFLAVVTIAVVSTFYLF